MAIFDKNRDISCKTNYGYVSQVNSCFVLNSSQFCFWYHPFETLCTRYSLLQLHLEVGLQRAILQILHFKVIVIHLGVTVLYVDTSKTF